MRTSAHLWMLVATLVAALLFGCGGDRERARTETGGQGESGSTGAGDSLDASPAPGGACEVDSDCVIATPVECCRNVCPEERGAYSRAFLREQSDLCAVVECAEVERVECAPELEPPPSVNAHCERGACVARQSGASG